jgi:hypothetical protein
MPRGIKGSGKSRKPAGEPGQPRRRGRTPKGVLPEAVRPAELATAEAELVRKSPARPHQARQSAARRHGGLGQQAHCHYRLQRVPGQRTGRGHE